VRELNAADPTLNLDLSWFRLYDLRHCLGALYYEATGSRSVTGDILDHQQERTTRRYALAAVDPKLVAATEAAKQILAALPADTTEAAIAVVNDSAVVGVKLRRVK